MKLIGITGGVGCGKSVATVYLQERGYSVVDADLIVKALLKQPEIQEQILQRFQTLDKKELRNLIFHSAEKRKLLEGMIHPKVMEKIQEAIMIHRRQSHEILFISIPLLFEKKLETIFDSVISISCSEENQLQRLQSRDSMDGELAKAMIGAQLSTSEKAAKAQYVITNDKSFDDFHDQIENVLSKVLS